MAEHLKETYGKKESTGYHKELGISTSSTSAESSTRGSFVTNPWEYLIFGTALLMVIALAIERLLAFLSGRGSFFYDIYSFIKPFLPFLRILSFVFSGVLIVVSYRTLQKLKKVNYQYKKFFINEDEHDVSVTEILHPPASPANKKWQQVLERINSINPSDWKLAIIEADILLGEMLEKMGYFGETIADRLKNVEKSDFTNLDKAWEAHKVRNVIVHEGADFLINEREARRIIELFREVFKEFKYI